MIDDSRIGEVDGTLPNIPVEALVNAVSCSNNLINTNCKILGAFALGVSITAIAMYEIYMRSNVGNNDSSEAGLGTGTSITDSPSNLPTILPTEIPTYSPSNIPTLQPSKTPTINPSEFPTTYPSLSTEQPSTIPTISPSDTPSTQPSKIPTFTPSNNPTVQPSKEPSISPSNTPTRLPTVNLMLEMVTIPTGSFIMGDSFGAGDSDEVPTHEVTISTIVMGVYEVSYNEWTIVRNWGILNGYDFGNGQAGSDSSSNPINDGSENSHPVVYVSWYEVVKWCNALSEMEVLEPIYTVEGNAYRTGTGTVVMDITKTGYRLPTEAEWAYSARGGLVGECFPWDANGCYIDGVDIKSDCSNVDSKTANCNNPSVGTKPVGSCSLPNGYGLYDMAGNVEEWVWDWYDSTYYSSSPSIDPEGPSSGTNKALVRGGSWYLSVGLCRVAYRGVASSRSTTYSWIGFRVCRRP